MFSLLFLRFPSRCVPTGCTLAPGASSFSNGTAPVLPVRPSTSSTKTLGLLVLTAAACLAAAPGDRSRDVNVTFPSQLLVQDGGTVIDVTNPPTVTPPMTQAKVEPIWGNSNSYSADLPNGTYLVSGTIIYPGPDLEHVAPAVDDLTGDGVVNVVDIQIEINAALGLGCAAK